MEHKQMFYIISGVIVGEDNDITNHIFLFNDKQKAINNLLSMFGEIQDTFKENDIKITYMHYCKNYFIINTEMENYEYNLFEEEII
jgi:hypothetical protein